MGERLFLRLDDDPLHGPESSVPAGTLRAFPVGAALRRQPSLPWAELALEGGFYDQSHLGNEFRAVCGVTPTEFLGRAIAGFSKTPG